MAKTFGHNDIQTLLQHLNKYQHSSSSGTSVSKNVASDNNDTDSKVAKVSKKRSNEVVAVQTEKIKKKKSKKSEKSDTKELDSNESVADNDEQAVDTLDTGSSTEPAHQTTDGKTKQSERSKLLRASCLEKLMEAQFRNINEYLYSNNSLSALTYMNDELFNKYHQAYRKIVERWPVKPLDVIIDKIEKINFVNKKKVIIADLGCGDAQLAQHFAQKKQTNVKVHSFDLVAANEFVTQASMHNVPLDADSCNVVVFCLSLMGTNIKDYLLEANRILKKDGHLIIIEVASRFEEMSVNKFNKTLESFHFNMKKQQFLQPNNFFVLFQGQKTESITKLKGLPNLSLKACRYKIR